MTSEQVTLLEASLDKVVELELVDGSSLLAKPLFVYTGEDNPDVFVLPLERATDGTPVAGQAARSILLSEIAEIRVT